MHLYFPSLLTFPHPSSFLQIHPFNCRDRHQLIQQIQVIGNGALGPEASTAIRHVAAQNGVWSLGNFGGLPPRSAMTPQEQKQVNIYCICICFEFIKLYIHHPITHCNPNSLTQQ